MMTLKMPQINDVRLTGRLTRDPELRFTGKGQPVCRFDLAVNRRYKDVTGEWKDDTSYVSIVVWAEMAQRCNDRLKKGSPVFVEGRLKSRAWETKEGQKRVSLEVVAQRVQFLAKMEGQGEADGAPDTEDTAPKAAEVPVEAGAQEEEIPF